MVRFLQSSCPTAHSHQHRVSGPSPCVLAKVCIAAIFKFCINILASRWPYLVGALICFSLMANGIGCLCRCVFAIRLSFVKCLFMSLAHFLTGLFSFLLLSFECSLHILVRNPLSDMRFANMSPSLSIFMPKLSLLIF